MKIKFALKSYSGEWCACNVEAVLIVKDHENCASDMIFEQKVEVKLFLFANISGVNKSTYLRSLFFT